MQPKLLAMLAITVVAVSSTGAFAFVDNETQASANGVTDGPTILGHIEVTVMDETGNIKEYRQTDNLVVTEGLKAFSERLFEANLWTLNSGEFKNIGVGTGTTGAAAENTDLETQQGGKQLGTVSQDGTVGAKIEFAYPASGSGSLQNSTGTVAITEAILSDSIANATGNLFARQTFTAVNVGQSDSLTISWTITPADSDSS